MILPNNSVVVDVVHHVVAGDSHKESRCSSMCRTISFDSLDSKDEESTFNLVFVHRKTPIGVLHTVQVKMKIVNILAKVASLCIYLNIDLLSPVETVRYSRSRCHGGTRGREI